jgi:RimJ/RimL family protein N-acetyltransferase
VVGKGVLRTARLVLREWRDDDLEPFAAMSADREVMEHFPSPLTREESDAAAARIRAHFKLEGFGLWAMEVPGVAPFIGFTGLARPRFRPEVVEIGWRLARAHWGAGYATEAALAALAWGFTNVQVEEFVAFVRPSNVRSQRVMQRIGLERDPSADFDHPLIPEGHSRLHWLYRISRVAWNRTPRRDLAKVEPFKS